MATVHSITEDDSTKWLPGWPGCLLTCWLAPEPMVWVPPWRKSRGPIWMGAESEAWEWRHGFLF